MNFEYLAVLLLPLEIWFAGLFEEKICEVSEEWVAFPRAWDIRDGDMSVSAVEQTKQAHDYGCCGRAQERGLEKTFE